MARKNLLTESEIRSFMKLANLKHIGAPQLEEMAIPATDIEEEMEDELPPEVEVELDDEPADDLGAELGADDMGAESAEDLVVSISNDLEKLAGMAGVDVDVEDETGEDDLGDIEGLEDEEPMMEADDENLEEGEDENLEEIGTVPFGKPPRTHGRSVRGRRGYASPEEPPETLPATDPADDETPRGPRAKGRRPDAAKFAKRAMQEDAIVAEVAKRVASRLQDGKNKQELIENLTEKILNRLTK